MKIKTKDKGFDAMMSGGYGQMPHPANMFGWLGENVNPAFFMTEFQGSPVSYALGSKGADFVNSLNPKKPTLGGTSKPSTGGGSNAFNWTFPQYSQSWAFTPPDPTPYNNPPAFNPNPSTPAPNTGALTPFSLTELQKKYGK